MAKLVVLRRAHDAWVARYESKALTLRGRERPTPLEALGEMHGLLRDVAQAVAFALDCAVAAGAELASRESPDDCVIEMAGAEDCAHARKLPEVRRAG